MGKRNKVTTRDIAEILGISQSTVSMILSNKPNVSFTPETVQKVKDTAKKLGYQKAVPKEKTKNQLLKNTIMILCPLMSNEYYSMMIQTITEHARLYGYTTMSITTSRDAFIEETYLDLLSNAQLAGIISLYPPNKIQKVNAISKQIPIVSVGDKPPGCRFDSVELDSTKPGYLIGEHLLSLGHTHVTYISSPMPAKELGRLNRLNGVKSSFLDYGISEQQIEVRFPSTATYLHYDKLNAEYQNGYDMTSRALEEHTLSTAFIGNNDMCALGIMAAIQDHGYSIPKDFSVCGFDNIVLSAMPQISLTTIDHASVPKAKEAVEIIHRKNQQKKDSSERNYIMRLEYEPQLIVRKSTGKCRK